MADVDLKLKSIDALVHIHSAVKNDQQYSSASPAIANFIETIYLYLVDSLRQDAPLVFEALEKNILSGENISNQKEDKTINVSSLLNILHGFGFHSFSFDQDMEKEELRISVKLPPKNRKPAQDEIDLPMPTAENETGQTYPDNKADEIDLKMLGAKNKTEQAHPDNKAFVTLEKDQEIVSSPDNAEDQISESISSMEKVFTRINALDGAAASLPSEEKMDMIKELSIQVAQWVEKKETFTPEYEELCQRLETLLQDFISNRFFAEAASIINIFSKINNGTLKKDDKVQEVSLKILQNLASDNNFNILFKEINNNGASKKNDACQIFAGFGNIVINKLLDGLKNATDSKSRISIIHVMEEMGPAAIPAIKKSISMNGPWYYLRNLAYVLGRIGNETSVDALKPLLLHKETRVCKEAFKSIVQTGGNMKGPVLLSVLLLVDQELRVNIIEVLGKIKYREAVTDLKNMLRSVSSMSKNDQITMTEKICSALGAIGSPEAIKVISEIAESKSILGIGSYPKEVKYAAERALAYVKRKQ